MKLFPVALGLAAVAGAACAAGLSSGSFSDFSGHGHLRWASGCARPGWEAAGPQQWQRAELAASYSAYVACLHRRAYDDALWAADDIEAAAKEELEETNARGRLLGLIR